jgi:hypothetical protein
MLEELYDRYKSGPGAGSVALTPPRRIVSNEIKMDRSSAPPPPEQTLTFGSPEKVSSLDVVVALHSGCV